VNDWTSELEARGYPLTDIPAPAALYRPVVVHAGIAYVSGSLPIAGGQLVSRGTVGRDVTLDEARRAAELCAANVLRALARELGVSSRIERVLRVGGYVASAPGFTEQHLVVNGASEFFLSILGEAGAHARSAIGVPSLPLGASVEIDAVFAIR
jgi:enamine deaminase RidA (YjgF/YER057c/UK114 family)